MNVIKSERLKYEQLKYNRYVRKSITFETVTGWAFLSPLLIVALIFSTAAIGIGLWITFYSGQVGDLEYVGFDNWKMLSNKALNLGLAFKNTFFFAGVSVPIILVVSLVLSGILNSKLIKRKEIFLGIFFLPQVTSAIASTLIFKQLFSPNGFIKIDYLSNPRLALWVVIISAIWGGVAGQLITFNTAFTSINKTQYEAAELDGAGGLKKFLNVTLPSIGPIIAYALIMGIIGGLGVFDGPYLLAATANVNPDGLMTVMLKGFTFIRPPQAQVSPDLGLGTTILFLLSFVMAAATIVANIFMPMSKKTN